MLVQVNASISAVCPKLAGRLLQILTPRKESVVSPTQACASGGAPSLFLWSSSELGEVEISSFSSWSPRAGISLHCLKRDLAAEQSSEGRCA